MAKATNTLRSVPAPDETQGDIREYADRWRREMKADSKAERTIHDYCRVVGGIRDKQTGERRPGYFDVWLTENGRSLFVGEITKDDIEDYKAELLEENQPATAKAYVAAIKSFFRWLTEALPADDGITENPAEHVRLPKVAVKVMNVPTLQDVEAVLATTRGTSFEDRRDRALIALFMSSGMREAGIAGLRVEDVHLDDAYCTIMLKGGKKEARAYMWASTVKDMDRYITARKSHPYAASPWLWLGRRGKMGTSGIYQTIKTRAERAGVGHLTVHDFRRFTANYMLENDESVDNVMTTLGWTDRTMPARYAAATRDARAQKAHAKLDPGLR